MLPPPKQPAVRFQNGLPTPNTSFASTTKNKSFTSDGAMTATSNSNLLSSQASTVPTSTCPDDETGSQATEYTFSSIASEQAAELEEEAMKHADGGIKSYARVTKRSLDRNHLPSLHSAKVPIMKPLVQQNAPSRDELTPFDLPPFCAFLPLNLQAAAYSVMRDARLSKYELAKAWRSPRSFKTLSDVAQQYNASTRPQEWLPGYTSATLAGKWEISKTKDGPLLDLTLHPPRREPSCSLQRKFGSDRFLIVDFPDTSENKLSERLKGQSGRRWAQLLIQRKKNKRAAENQLDLAESGTSLVWFFAISGPELAEPPLDSWLGPGYWAPKGCASSDERAVLMLESGFEPSSNSYLRKEVLDIANFVFSLKAKQFKVRLPASTVVYGIYDPTGILMPGEAYLFLSDPIQDEETEKVWSILDGREVLVSRNPSRRNSDVQKIRLVYRTELAHLRDVIVFSSHGPRPLASKLSGGDYDGDTFWVCWDEALAKPFKNAPAPWEAEQKAAQLADFGIEQDKVKLRDFIGLTSSQGPQLDYGARRWIRRSTEMRMRTEWVGVVSNVHVALTYKEGTISSNLSSLLVDLHDFIIDADKQGYIYTNEAFAEQFGHDLDQEDGEEEFEIGASLFDDLDFEAMETWQELSQPTRKRKSDDIEGEQQTPPARRSPESIGITSTIGQAADYRMALDADGLEFWWILAME
ncbi:hypothetical protein EJ03DRAFT_385915 [Teratosphaeria nubilosa]|uniref:RNA-dependent RNA polymerase n=1 Tax=Teratosphaeria nubilosa TaxID=161662 RepID=A0A6G1KWT3_9PEZI|nr:hypothetical protein EJ03DRAFT_385915 [Teratosphaeria nubilosa]